MKDAEIVIKHYSKKHIEEHKDFRCILCDGTGTDMEADGHYRFFAPHIPIDINESLACVCTTCINRILYQRTDLFMMMLQSPSFKEKLTPLLRKTLVPFTEFEYKEEHNNIWVHDQYAELKLMPSKEDLLKMLADLAPGETFTSANTSTVNESLITTNVSDTNNSPSQEGKKSIALTPKEINRQLNEYVIGQEDAKEILSIAAHSHYKRTSFPDTFIEKDNVLLIGPTGTGKTHLIRRLSIILDTPFVIFDANTLTAAGYVGQDVESMLSKLLFEANGDIEAAQKGIIFIDEVDKIAVSNNNDSNINTTSVQQALLKLIEGGDYQVPKNGNSMKPDEIVNFNTSNVLFIFGGAFVGLEDIVNKKDKSHSIGFGHSQTEEVQTLRDIEHLGRLEQKHLREYGVIPELIGRISMYSRLQPLNEHLLYRILTEPKNNLIDSYKNQFSHDGIEFSFSDDALKKIAHLASKNEEGARSLKTILARSLKDPLYHLPGSDVTEYELKASEIKEHFS